MAQAMVTAAEINAAAGYQPTRDVSSPAFAPGRPITPRLDAWRMQTREVKDHMPCAAVRAAVGERGRNEVSTR
jgi:hypothetical protein